MRAVIRAIVEAIKAMLKMLAFPFRFLGRILASGVGGVAPNPQQARQTKPGEEEDENQVPGLSPAASAPEEEQPMPPRGGLASNFEQAAEHGHEEGGSAPEGPGLSGQEAGNAEYDSWGKGFKNGPSTPKSA